ncbi:MAG: transcription-repair coupling factor, partial [Actinomycetota bacterium]|nr:transcription-repair coupling factor [Actinomycetota bacterium]
MPDGTARVILGKRMTSSHPAALRALLDLGRESLADVTEPGEIHVGSTLRAYTIGLLADHVPTLLAVVATDADAEALNDDLSAFLGEQAVAVFPAWETLPHERLSPQPATVGQRLRVLDRLRTGAGDGVTDVEPASGEAPPGEARLRAVIAPVRALLQPMDPRLTAREPVRLHAGFTGGLDGLVESLAALGYTRTTMVEHRGEFAVRGGIVDVFASAADHPVRVEFWGDDVDSLRWFAAASQR